MSSGSLDLFLFAPPLSFYSLRWNLNLDPKSLHSLHSLQGFFPAMYSQLGLAFNSLSLWEVTRMDPGQIFQHVPADLIGGYQYFNVPVEAKEGRDWNAVEVLKGKLKAARDAYEKAAAIHGIRVERPAGQTGVSGSPLIYVVVKLDIDNSPIELALMKRLLELLPSANSTQSSDEPPFEIHELFFEHHTDVPDVIGPDIWCGGNCPSLAESYDLFTELRRRGVRSHSWI